MTDTDRFWAFALAVYMPPGAQALFLRLQDEDEMDVPLALFCLWCGADGIRLSEDAMRAAIAFSADWRRDRVEPLRALRHAWKSAPAPFPDALSEAARQRVAQAEQSVERLQMDHLVTLRAGEEGGEGAAMANLHRYCRIAALSPPDSILAEVARIALVHEKY